MNGTDSMMTKKIPNSGASLPANATIVLPPAQASQVRSQNSFLRTVPIPFQKRIRIVLSEAEQLMSFDPSHVNLKFAA